MKKEYNKLLFQIITISILLPLWYIVLFQGFGFPSISPLLSSILKIIITILIQVFFVVTFKNIYIKPTPFFISVIIFLYGLILNIRYLISFKKFLFLDLLDFAIFLITTGIVLLILKLLKILKNK